MEQKMNEINSFKKGITDGLPICFGYFAVSFAFGIFTVGSGLSVIQSLLISMTNVTSAGQFAAVPIMISSGSLIELAASQLVINLRYSLMSISLANRLGKSVRLIDRFIIAFVNTDEVFAVSSSKDVKVGRNYMFGLILTPYFGWALGTLGGAVAGDVLPDVIVSALGLAIYGMFVAIVVPPAKKSRPVMFCVLISVALSCAFRYISALSAVPSGFVVIICAVTASAVMALVSPVSPDSGEEGNADG